MYIPGFFTGRWPAFYGPVDKWIDPSSHILFCGLINFLFWSIELDEIHRFKSLHLVGQFESWASDDGCINLTAHYYYLSDISLGWD